MFLEATINQLCGQETCDNNSNTNNENNNIDDNINNNIQSSPFFVCPSKNDQEIED